MGFTVCFFCCGGHIGVTTGGHVGNSVTSQKRRGKLWHLISIQSTHFARQLSVENVILILMSSHFLFCDTTPIWRPLASVSKQQMLDPLLFFRSVQNPLIFWVSVTGKPWAIFADPLYRRSKMLWVTWPSPCQLTVIIGCRAIIIGI